MGFTYYLEIYTNNQAIHRSINENYILIFENFQELFRLTLSG